MWWLCTRALLKLNPRPTRMALGGFLLGGNARVMRGAFGCGALRYRAIVAVKPLV
jgi:hypothetical protein